MHGCGTPIFPTWMPCHRWMTLILHCLVGDVYTLHTAHPLARHKMNLKIKKFQLDFTNKVQVLIKLKALPTSQIFSLKTHKHTRTHTFVSSHTKLPQLADRIRADKGRPARLLTVAPSYWSWKPQQGACLTTWRTEEETGARATATPYPGAVWHGNHCHSRDINPGQRWWLCAPRRKPVPQPFTSA